MELNQFIIQQVTILLTIGTILLGRVILYSDYVDRIVDKVWDYCAGKISKK